MSKITREAPRLVTDQTSLAEDILLIIPTVTHSEEPKIKLYDPKGGYYYRKIGFLSSIQSED